MRRTIDKHGKKPRTEPPSASDTSPHGTEDSEHHRIHQPSLAASDPQKGDLLLDIHESLQQLIAIIHRVTEESSNENDLEKLGWIADEIKSETMKMTSLLPVEPQGSSSSLPSTIAMPRLAPAPAAYPISPPSQAPFSIIAPLITISSGQAAVDLGPLMRHLLAMSRPPVAIPASPPVAPRPVYPARPPASTPDITSNIPPKKRRRRTCKVCNRQECPGSQDRKACTQSINSPDH
ncbi:hypothetical protein DM01DRAFT_1410275 [Hesseltinella vesiculosa]|uniref:Uncharacterized protein n=1 Tax=Hesseltinella vesiculosa TaxID=101127 RepID=A0A1X2G7L9_9FUNG|nr:hypothetical protein DM01DRAFT_1410275 [Hesseltinella vesiculosa]